MKLVVLVPDPPRAHALGGILPVLAPSARVVAYGAATAAALPPGLDLVVYPVREATRLPAAFLGALLDHERPDAVVAPGGALTIDGIPALVLDTDPGLPAAEVVPMPPAPGVRLLTATAERRAELAEAGHGSVDVEPGLLDASGRVRPELAPVVLALAEEACGRAAAPPPPAGPEPPAAAAEAFRDALPNRPVLVLAAGRGLDDIGAHELSGVTVVAVPEALPWLADRMGLAQFVCVDALPGGAAAEELARCRGIVVHASHVPAGRVAPFARATVGVPDLHRAGGPRLGWSDDPGQGYFPGPGTAALAVQWGAWLGTRDIVIAGLTAQDIAGPWNAFLVGATEMVEARGGRLALLDWVEAAPAGAAR